MLLFWRNSESALAHTKLERDGVLCTGHDVGTELQTRLMWTTENVIHCACEHDNIATSDALCTPPVCAMDKYITARHHRRCCTLAQLVCLCDSCMCYVLSKSANKTFVEIFSNAKHVCISLPQLEI